MNKGIKRLFTGFKLHILRDKKLLAIKKWHKNSGDESIRFDYSLGKQDIVFDVGGYNGEVAQKIYDKYGCNIYIFEPVTKFYEKIVEEFSDNKKVKVYHYGLGARNYIEDIVLMGESSSVLNNKRIGKTEKVTIKDISDVIAANNINRIHLFKINIEGGEYDVLDRMIERNLISLCDNIQIQFHDFAKNARKKRENIRRHLSKTHRLTYDYYFVWENWEKIATNYEEDDQRTD